MMDVPQIKLLPDLFPAAHRAGEGDLLRVWLLARASVPAPGLRITRTALLAAISEHLHVKPRHAHNLLVKGDGLWWRLDTKHDYVYLIGAKPIMLRLGGEPSDAPTVELDLADLASLMHFYARCYAAYMQRYVHGDTSQMVSRDTLRHIFGVTRNTLRAWEREAGVLVLQNFAFAPPSAFANMPDRHVEYHCRCGKALNTFEKFCAHRERECKEHEYVVVWDRPNSYAPPATPTVGTASPIGRARLDRYQQRHAPHPDETRCQALSRPKSSPDQTCNAAPLGWLVPDSRTHYRTARNSDALPLLLLNKGVPLTRLWRATSGTVLN
jgi:hypothetical protein